MDAILTDWRTAPIGAGMRATLAFLEKLVLTPEDVTADDARAVRAAGVSEQALEDAIHVCTLFSVYVRLADAFEFDIPDEHGFAQSAAMLLKRGYL